MTKLIYTHKLSDLRCIFTLYLIFLCGVISTKKLDVLHFLIVRTRYGSSKYSPGYSTHKNQKKQFEIA
jgi:hypothetical protein